MEEARLIVNIHTKIKDVYPPKQKYGISGAFETLGRSFQKYSRTVHWIYTGVNFALFMRVVRFIGIITVLWQNVITEHIPTFIYNDERRRILRWDEEDTRQKSIFYTSALYDDDDSQTSKNTRANKSSGKEPVHFNEPAKKQSSKSNDSTTPPANVVAIKPTREITEDPKRNSVYNEKEGGVPVPVPVSVSVPVSVPKPEDNKEGALPIPKQRNDKEGALPKPRTVSIMKKDAKPSQRKLLRFEDDETNTLTQPRPSRRSILQPERSSKDKHKSDVKPSKEEIPQNEKKEM
jgi:hypothetical protein